MPRIAVTADIHCPKYFDLFKESLQKMGDVDLFLIVGDSVLRNDYSQLPKVVSAIREVFDGQIVACFGNEEYEESKTIYEKCKDIIWLDDEAITLKINRVTMGILGSRGSLDRPTYWQRTYKRGIWQIYRERVRRIDNLLANLEGTKIIMTHYAPTYRTLVGEKERIWPEMGCEKFEDVIRRRQPDVWFHGHAHKGTVFDVMFGKTLVSNVSLPARKEIVVVTLPRVIGLNAFFE